MSAWLKRFGLHLAAAVGATGVFVAAAAVGANQVRQRPDLVAPPVATIVRTREPNGQRRPTVVVATPTPSAAPGASTGSSSSSSSSGQSTPATTGDATQPAPAATPSPRSAAAVRPERSLAGTIASIGADSLQVVGVGGRTWTVEPAPGALIRLNGKAAKLDGLQPGDGVVILGQAEAGPGLHFLAHAITAKAK
ncbi:MAG: hypothetical protein JO057_11035 [Chloroflexi bacterium]|nr:hypothetical protein [Chloroflexota bacterium]